VQTIAPTTTLIDLEYLGTTQVIASCLLEGNGGPTLVDPGPSSALPTLLGKLSKKEISVADVQRVFLTHIHLDHAGATGSLIRDNPAIRVYVHEKGAKHLIDPSRLLRSAERLYGSEMDRLWGDFLPVPAANVVSLQGGEHLSGKGRGIEVLYTPGHASHHISYFDTHEGIAFVGDTAGVRISNMPYVLPVTPPPDINPPFWMKSMEDILERGPRLLFLTHFGPADRVLWHFEELRDRLTEWSERVRTTLTAGGGDADLSAQFATWVSETLHQKMPVAEVERYHQGIGLELCWAGLARYWRKKETPTS